jgi:hypothetical protein
MKRPARESDGLYHIKGKTYKLLRGSRAQVWNGTAYKTEGGLLKSALLKSNGRIVSAKKHKTAKKELRLQKYGYFAEKGKFGFVKKSVSRKQRKSSKKKLGGSLPLAPATLDTAYTSHNAGSVANTIKTAGPAAASI